MRLRASDGDACGERRAGMVAEFAERLRIQVGELVVLPVTHTYSPGLSSGAYPATTPACRPRWARTYCPPRPPRTRGSRQKV